MKSTFHKMQSRALATKNKCGATMVEAAIAIPLFLLVLAGIIDFGHKLYVRVMLKYATHIAVDAGTKYDLVAYNDCSARCAGSTNSSCVNQCALDWQGYLSRLQSIEGRGEDVLLNSRAVGDAGQNRVAFQPIYDPRVGDWVRVLFLRPGEYGCLDADPNCPDPARRIEHPTRQQPIGVGEEWKQLLSAHPVVAVTRVEAPYFLLPLPSASYTIYAYGFPSGLNPDLFASGAGNSNSTPTPNGGTPTPTPTPGGTPPGGTPTPSPTPTPTPPAYCNGCINNPPHYCCIPFIPGCGCQGSGM